MSTRGACCFRYRETDYVMYNHFDSYPSGLGIEVAAVVAQWSDGEMMAACERIKLVDEREPAPPEAQELYRNIANTSVGSQQLDDWYVLLRHFQGDLAAYIDGHVEHMIDKASFLLEPTWCEYAYIINLDTQELEVYKATNHDLAGRYVTGSSCPGEAVSLIASIPFATVRSWWPTIELHFLKAIGYPDEEDE